MCSRLVLVFDFCFWDRGARVWLQFSKLQRWSACRELKSVGGIRKLGSLFGTGPSAAAPNAQVQEDERRQLTVLFYDIVGSTQMLQSLDPEEIRGALMRVHDVARTQISAHMGSLEQVLGDGGMAYFGFPKPHEDAVLQSVRAAWGILQARAEMVEEGQPMPDIRIGVATSIVVLSSDAGSLRQGGLGAVGVAPNLSARLQSAAAPNTALVDRSTFRLSGRAFDFERRDGLSLKGFPDVDSAYVLADQKMLRSRFDRRAVSGVGLIGRGEEIATLKAAWARAMAGSGGGYAIKGEAGLGKSHLSSALADHMDGDGLVLRLQCEPSTAKEALHPLITMYEHEYETRSPDDPCAQAAVKTAGSVHAAQEDPALSAEARRSAIVDGCVEAFLELASLRPCVLLAEDLHWIDEVTLAFLTTLASVAHTAPLMIIATARPETDLSELSAVSEELPLMPFAIEEIKDLAQAAVEVSLSDDVLDWITSKSDGNPLFAIELAKYMEDQGGATPLVDSDIGVESLRDLLAARLESAGLAKRAAQIASVIGRDVPLDLLVRLTEGRLNRGELEADLSRLVEHGIKDITDEGRVYTFHHALMREAAYESQLRRTRQNLHGRLVDLIESDPQLAASVSVGVQAEHCLLAGRLAQGIGGLIDAAELAIQRSALTAPRATLERAIGLLNQLKDRDVARQFELRAISLLGPLVTLLEGPRAAAPLYERGQDLCFELEKGARGEWFPILWGWWFTASDLIEQSRRSEALIGSITVADSNEARLQALHCGWATMFDVGAHDDSLDAVREGLALYDPEEARRSRLCYGHDAKVCGLGERALSLWLQGDGDGSLVAIDEALRWGEEIGHLPSLLHALDIANTGAFFRRDAGEIKRVLTQIGCLSGSEASPAMLAKVRIFDAWFAAQSGDMDAHHRVSEGLATLRNLGVLEDTAIYADISAETATLCGVADTAIAGLTHEIAEAKRTRLLFWVPELLRRQALLAYLSETSDDPSVFLDEGLELALSQNANMLVLRNAETRLALGMGLSKALRAQLAERILGVTGAVERDHVVKALGL